MAEFDPLRDPLAASAQAFGLGAELARCRSHAEVRDLCIGYLQATGKARHLERLHRQRRAEARARDADAANPPAWRGSAAAHRIEQEIDS